MKVAVIGAGFSGMLAAYLLEKKGIDVTVYEKEDVIGGHCRTMSSNHVTTELGTIFSFSHHLKALLIELQVPYTERFTYRKFIDEHYHSVEHVARDQVPLLMNELGALEAILETYTDTLSTINYGLIHEDLLLPLCQFLRKHELTVLCQVIAPLLSSFGFGSVCDTQAYYAFKVFNIETIHSFIKGDKLLFINQGTSQLIKALGQTITDIRYSIEVKNVEVIDKRVKVETDFGCDSYDKVLITTKLPRDVIKDDLYNRLMKKIDTNPFLICAYEVANKDLVTTYYKANLGKKDQLQFYHVSRQNHRTVLVTYAYGSLCKATINGITEALTSSGIDVKHLITAKQWYIFPHLNEENLTTHFYEDISQRQKVSPINLIGSLVSKPEIGNLYISVKNAIDELLDLNE